MSELRDFYAALVESSDDAIVAKNPDGIVIAWNPAAERLFGWTSEEMVGGSIRRLLPPDRQQEEDHILARIRAGERVYPFYTKRLHKDGHLLDVQVSVSPVRDASGKIIGASKMARDVGEYLHAQEALRESEGRFRLLAENISQFAWIARADGHIYWYNKRWYDYTGTTLEEMQGWGWAKVHHPEHIDRVTRVWREALASGEEWEDTFPLRGKDGEFRWFLSRATPIRDAEGKIVSWFGTNTDITEQREQSEQIRLLLMEVNHRSKNMLTTIQALARRSAPSKEGFASRFEQRLQGLAINQDILVGREWREVPIEELVRRQLSFIENAPGGYHLAGPPLSITPRAAETIGMALHELAINALKYGSLSTPGGSVDVGWSHRPDGSGLRMWWRESGGPSVAPPERDGFGTTLIRDMPQRSLGAEVTQTYHADGVCWELVCDDDVLARRSASGA